MFSIKSLAAAILAVAVPMATASAMPAASTPQSRTIVDIAAGSAQHGTLVAALQAAGLVETLSGAGPFTVFAPNDAAFQRLPAGTVESLLRPENRSQLQAVLAYHVVPGRVTAADLVGMIRTGGGEARLTTVQGGTLSARMAGRNVVIADARGATATVVAADLAGANGVIHVTDAVSLPR